MEETSKLKIIKKNKDNSKENKDNIKINNEKTEESNEALEIKSNEQNNNAKEEDRDIINLTSQIESSDPRLLFIRNVFGTISIKTFLYYLFSRSSQINRFKDIFLSFKYDTIYIIQYLLVMTGILFLIIIFGGKLLKIVPFNYLIFIALSIIQISFFPIVLAFYKYYYNSLSVGLLLTSICCLLIVIYSILIKNEYSYAKLGLLVFLGQLFTVWFDLVFFEDKVMPAAYAFFFLVFIGNYLVYESLSIIERYGTYFLFDDLIFAIFQIYVDFIKMPYILLKIGAKIAYKNIKEN